MFSNISSSRMRVFAKTGQFSSQSTLTMRLLNTARNTSSNVLENWKLEPPCQKQIFFSAQLSYLIYWLSYHRNYLLSMEKLRELSTINPQEDKYKEFLSVPSIGGFLSAPGPKNASMIQWLLRETLVGFDEDAYIVEWDEILNSILIFEPHRRKLTMVLRGSASIRDLVVNATVIPWNISPSHGIKSGKAHLGFWNRMKSSKSTYDKIIELNPIQVDITGHSLGAALGILIASHVSYNLKVKDTKISLITFGSPRIGNEAFCTGFNQLENVRHWRISNGWDPVTRIPPHAPAPIDYRHTGHHIWLSHDVQNLETKNHSQLKSTVYQVKPSIIGVLEASPELYKPSLTLLKGALEGGVYGVKGHHQMGGRNGYLSSLKNAKWGDFDTLKK